VAVVTAPLLLGDPGHAALGHSCCAQQEMSCRTARAG
jgi:hypothetical protein